MVVLANKITPDDFSPVKGTVLKARLGSGQNLSVEAKLNLNALSDYRYLYLKYSNGDQLFRINEIENIYLCDPAENSSTSK